MAAGRASAYRNLPLFVANVLGAAIVCALALVIHPHLANELFASGHHSQMWREPKMGITFASQLSADDTKGASNTRDAKPTRPLRALSILRGDVQRSGIERRFRIPLDLKIGWRFQPLNVGNYDAAKASPAVDESGIYIGSDTGRFFALTHDGRVRWRFDASDAQKGIHGTALLADERVYFSAYNGLIYCLNKSDGSIDWFIDSTGLAMGASLLPLGNSLIAAPETGSLEPYSYGDNGFLMRLSPSDGHREWTSPWLGEMAHSSPAYDPKSGLIFIGANNDIATAIDPLDGRFVWRTKLKGKVKASLLIEDDTVYSADLGGQITALNPLDGMIKWKLELSARFSSPPTRIPNSKILLVFDTSGIWSAIDITNRRVVWTLPTSQTMRFSTPLIAQDERGRWIAWLACQPTAFCAVNPATGAVLRTYEVGDWLSGAPVAWQGRIILALNESGGLVTLVPKD